MASTVTKNRDLKSTSYELFILQLSLLSLVNLLIMMLPGTKPVFRDVVRTMDLFITVIFVGDFLYRLLTAESKRDYFFKNYGWADLLSSMPMQQFKVFRIFRIIRVFRLLRVIGIRNMGWEVRRGRAESALHVTIFLVILVLEISSLLIISIEARLPEANIKTASDAIWWGYVTITTVGYGDLYPVTNSGRTVGIFLLTAGVGLFGVLTGYLANAFLAPPDEGEANAVIGENVTPNDAHTLVAELSTLLDEQAQANAHLKQRLTALESALLHEQSG